MFDLGEIAVAVVELKLDAGSSAGMYRGTAVSIVIRTTLPEG